MVHPSAQTLSCLPWVVWGVARPQCSGGCFVLLPCIFSVRLTGLCLIRAGMSIAILVSVQNCQSIANSGTPTFHRRS